MNATQITNNGARGLKEAVKRASRPARRIWPRLSEAAIGTIALAIVAFAVLTQIPAVCRSASRLTFSNKYLAFANGLVNPFRSRSLLLNSDLPIYDLKIKRQPFAQVENAVSEARKQGWMSEDQKVWVRGRFIAHGREYNVKLRVRGDLPPHWAGPKKSWRIKFGNMKIEDDGEVREEKIYFQGKRQINLVVPHDRDYVVAPFVNAVMRGYGLVVPRDRFVILRINGRLQGLYYEVEHFDKPLLAAHGRPETTIFGQNDRALHFEQYTKLGTPVASDARYDIGTMNRAVDEDGQLAMRAMQVLIDHSLNPTPESFRRVRAVLDWEKYLRFRNITTLFNTNHVRFGSDNLRLYYDPSRGLLEPVPWDVHIVRMPKEPGTIDFWNSHGPDEIQRSTLLDPMTRLERNRLLWEMVDDGGDRLIGRYREMHEQLRPIAWADVLCTPVQAYKMDELKSDFEYNVRRVHKVLGHSSANVTFRLESQNQASLEVVALNFSGIRMKEIRVSAPGLYGGDYVLYEDVNANDVWDDGDPPVARCAADAGSIRFDVDKLVLPRLKYRGENIDGRYWEFLDTLSGRTRFFLVGKLAAEDREPIGWTPPEITVAAENAVTGAAMESVVVNQDEASPQNSTGITSYDESDVFDLDAPQRSLSEFLAANPQFSASTAHSAAVELSGSVTITGTVIVPNNVLLILNPGADVTMAPGASILCYGGLRAIGTPRQRIRIHDDGGGRAWKTLAVVRPPEGVVLKHVDVQGGGQTEINGILFTGGFAVHDGDLLLRDCRFFEMRGEDGINLKNGRISMVDCAVIGSASDAVDIDFGTGDVRNCRFADNVNDGLDISGSRLAIVGNRFENNGDKGLSVGEDSHPIVVDALFLENVIGISSKDLSVARIAHATFVSNKLAVEAKRKKPMFGGGTAEIVNSVFAGNHVLSDDDYFSRGQIDIAGSFIEDSAHVSEAPARSVFVDPAAGDYRLAVDEERGNGWTPERPDWLSDELDGLEAGGFRPQVPGVWSGSGNSGPAP